MKGPLRIATTASIIYTIRFQEPSSTYDRRKTPFALEVCRHFPNAAVAIFDTCLVQAKNFDLMGCCGRDLPGSVTHLAAVDCPAAVP
jgi:hypothetical protein